MPKLAMALDESEVRDAPVIDELAVVRALGVLRTAPDDIKSAEKKAFEMAMKLRRYRAQQVKVFGTQHSAHSFEHWLECDHEYHVLLALSHTLNSNLRFLQNSFAAASLIIEFVSRKDITSHAE